VILQVEVCERGREKGSCNREETGRRGEEGRIRKSKKPYAERHEKRAGKRGGEDE